MKATWLALVAGSLCLTVACTQSSSSQPTPTALEDLGSGNAGPAGLVSGSPSGREGVSGLPMSATIVFGQPDTGSSFPPPLGHDQSSHAKDNLVPRTVVIAQGGTVTFDLSGPGRALHQVAVYPDGTEPGDVDTGALAPPVATCPPAPRIVDPDGVILAPQPCAGGTAFPSHTFTQPGRYLVICTLLPHFANFQMYGWVIVK
jgi:plastocyanin